ncbi:pentapeptide repeat-containing protein [Streptomyces sp. NBC_01465]|uniref:pentapeptide repeat-containing protein n=1 Tax=Streptomyces sp. NBC_01465 TaxID=2903878 RepID=UPI002E363E3B|nr:pentapeptide repeat-containing protein [Streptomyces sp. NBC_01465]
MANLTPGTAIDYRGTPFTGSLLASLLRALRDPTTRQPRLGRARFGEAQFSGPAQFNRAQFSGDARFGGAQFSGPAQFNRAQFSRDAQFDGAQFSDAGFSRAQFSGPARFGGAQFSGPAQFGEARFSHYAQFGGAHFTDDAEFSRAQFSDDARFVGAQFSGNGWFDDVQFSGDARFGGARFSRYAQFSRAQFSGPAQFDRAQFSDDAGFSQAQFSDDASFGEAQFSGPARFGEAQFSGPARFDGTRFSGDAWFGGTQFSGDAQFFGTQFAVMSWFGPVVCGQRVDLSGAIFEVSVTLEIAAREVRCARTRWQSTAIVRLRYATADLSHAALSFPVAITAYPVPFAAEGDALVNESLLTGIAGVRVASLQGVDAAHLVLTDIDLTDCLFSGAFHLDQLRLVGRCSFATAPVGVHLHGIWPVRWTRRRILAEEHHWRAQNARQPLPVPGQAPASLSLAWRPGPHHPDPDLTPDPEDVAVVYRQLRKAFEDGKDEPGAADFYYGEMEMRRHDRTGTPPGERGLLFGYWLLSGYGLRSSRALAWLLAAMSLTVLLLMGFGLTSYEPDPATAGTLHGNKINLTTSSPAPALHGDWSQRMTWPRTEKAIRVAINSVVFRSSGQNLTTAGTYIEMASRLLEPTLLALAVLAVRGRIKR